MLTAASVIQKAAFIAHNPDYASTFGVDLLNSLLGDVCYKVDLALARGLFTFNFNPGLQSNFGSGPYNLPLDYLRASGSSGEGQKTFFWTLNGVPYPMVPCDLSEFDMQVQQAGLQSYPWLWATDLGAPLTDRITLVTSAATTANNALIFTAATNARLRAGQGVAGDGITPGTTVLAVSTALVTTGTTNTNFTVTGIPSTAQIQVGDTVTAADLPDNTQVASVDSPTQVTLTDAAALSSVGEAMTFAHVGAAVTLSAPATSTDALASVFFGIPPVAYAYPPPSGAYPVSIRYQRMMPSIVDVSKIPWFPDEGYLITELAGRLMEISDDTRTAEFIGTGTTPGRADRRLREYLTNANDKKNRPQTVELDRRRFGPSYRSLPSTKTVGW